MSLKFINYKDEYKEKGFVIIKNLLEKNEVLEIQKATNELIDKSKTINKSNDLFELELDHSQKNPKIKRINVPHKNHLVFKNLIKNKKILNYLKIFIGENIRFRNSKLNIKTSNGGQEIKFHQDWAFYPHTNSDLIAVGIMIDKVTNDNAPLVVFPKTHKGKIYDHHRNGFFRGSIDMKKEKLDFSTSKTITGSAGSVSFHHVKLLHGSRKNTSNYSRKILFLEYASSDAWPLNDLDVYGSYENYEKNNISGKISNIPRMEKEQIILPYPKPPKSGSIFSIQEIKNLNINNEKN